MMHLRRKLLWLLSMTAVALLAGCAGSPTRLDAQWISPQVAGKKELRSVMVMSAVRDSTNRRLFEDRMVAALQAAGVQARSPKSGCVGCWRRPASSTPW